MSGGASRGIRAYSLARHATIVVNKRSVRYQERRLIHKGPTTHHQSRGVCAAVRR